MGERADAELTGDPLEEARSFLGLLRAAQVIDTQTHRRRLGQLSSVARWFGAVTTGWNPRN